MNGRILLLMAVGSIIVSTLVSGCSSKPEPMKNTPENIEAMKGTGEMPPEARAALEAQKAKTSTAPAATSTP